MHPEATKLMVESIRRRERQGDSPTEPAYSVETLEDVVLTLASQLAAAEHQRDENLDAAGTLAARLTAAEQENAALVPALEEIAKAEGPYSSDELKFAENTIYAMQQIAIDALAARSTPIPATADNSQQEQ